MNKSKREIILEISSVLFSEKGYTATSMRDIAKGVGMEAASLYNHIRSKQEILEVLLMRGAEAYIQGMVKVDAIYTSPLEKVQKLIGLHIQIALEHPHIISLMTQEWRHLQGATKKQFIQQRKQYEKRLKELIIEGIEKKEFRNVNPDIALFSLLSTMRWFYAWYSKKNKMNTKELELAFCEVLIGGIVIN